MKNRSRGFSLVVVLALVAIASVVVFTSLKDTVVQERLAGNFQKSINARMLSERGVFDQISAIQTFLTNNPDADAQELVTLITDVESASQHAADLRFSAALRQTSPSDLAIDGYGERHGGDAISNLLFNFRLRQTGENSPFATALIGCEGVTNAQGSRIDSYDSRRNGGIYDVASAGSDADVITIVKDSSIVLSGGAITAGNVISTGTVTVSDGHFVGGTIRANGDIAVLGGNGPSPAGFPANTRIGGDIETQGNVSYRGGLLLGVIRAEGDVTFNPIYGVADANGTGAPIQYGGTLTLEQSARDVLSSPGTTIDHSSIMPTPNLEVPEVRSFDPDNIPSDFDTENPLTNCDPLSIANVVSDISNDVTPESGLMLEYVFGIDTSATFTPTEGRHLSNEFTPGTGSAFGINLDSFYFFDELTIDGSELIIDGGDVVIVVAGDFLVTANFRSEIIIRDGSSLTLIVNGTSVIQKSATVERPQITDSGLPPFSLYSAYENTNAYNPSVCNTGTSSNYGVLIEATTDNYLTIYAPYSHVAIRQSGSIFGSVRGKTATLCGSGDIHFDVDLRNIIAGSGNGGNATAAFEGLRFKAVY